MISLGPYRELLARADVRQSFVASLLGRLPIGVTGLAILLLVQATSGSFARGGAATACYVAGLSVIAPALGRLIDRYGPRTLLLSCAVVFPAVLSSLVYSTANTQWNVITLALAALAGGSFPPITPCMRTYLRHALGEGRLISTAYSLESVLIELVFIVGPLFVALFVAYGSPELAVLFSATCAFLGTLLFLRSPAVLAWRTDMQKRTPGVLGPLKERGFPALIAVILCYSVAFGMTEIGITARATELGEPALAGVLLGLMSAGSAFGGLAYGSRSWHFPLAQQFAAMLALMGLGLSLLAFQWSPWVFAPLCIVGGVVMAPALIIQSMLVAKISRAHQLTEAFTWSASALLAGIGIGFAIGGAVLERLPATAALMGAAVSALLAAVAAFAALRR